MRPLLARVELEVRRPDHGDGVGARLGGVRGERDRVGRRLGAAVRGDERAARDRLEPELEPAPALVRGEQDRLAVRAEGEHAVEPGADEEVRVRPERLLVEPCRVVAQRRRGGGDRPVEPCHQGCSERTRSIVTAFCTRSSSTVKRFAAIAQTLGSGSWERSASSGTATSSASPSRGRRRATRSTPR